MKSCLIVINRPRFGAIGEDPDGIAATTQCDRCEHNQGYSNTVKDIVCKAYPLGIPGDLLFDRIKHTSILEDQEGEYLYEIAKHWKSVK